MVDDIIRVMAKARFIANEQEKDNIQNKVAELSSQVEALKVQAESSRLHIETLITQNAELSSMVRSLITDKQNLTTEIQEVNTNNIEMANEIQEVNTDNIEMANSKKSPVTIADMERCARGGTSFIDLGDLSDDILSMLMNLNKK